MKTRPLVVLLSLGLVVAGCGGLDPVEEVDTSDASAPPASSLTPVHMSTESYTCERCFVAPASKQLALATMVDDLSGDKKPDLLVSAYLGSEVVGVVFEDPLHMARESTWNSEVVFDGFGLTGQGRMRLQGAGDVDGDGQEDVVLVIDRLLTVRGESDPSDPRAPRIGDEFASGIGVSDLSLSVDGQRFFKFRQPILLGIGYPGNSPGPPLATPVGDLDGDGLDDLVFVIPHQEYGEVGVRFLPGGRLEGIVYRGDFGDSSLAAMQSCDYNGDGQRDLLLGGRSDADRWLEAFWGPIVWSDSVQSDELRAWTADPSGLLKVRCVADVSGDQGDDVVLMEYSEQRIHIWSWNDEDRWVDLPDGVLKVRDAVSFDLDGDGQNELAVLARSTQEQDLFAEVLVYTDIASNNARLWLRLSIPGDPVNLSPSPDLSGDGTAELVVTVHNMVAVVLGEELQAAMRGEEVAGWEMEPLR